MGTEITRRALLGGAIGAAASGALASASGAADSSAAAPDSKIYGVPTVDPLIARRADPFITRPVDGWYYFTGSVPEYDRIVVRGAATVAGLATATESVVWRRPASGRMAGHIWAPELHRIDDRWYIYFAAGDSDDKFRVRIYVLQSALADPRDASGWKLLGKINTGWDSFSLDATTFAHQGRRYLVWAQGEPGINANSSLYIAEMRSPLALSGAAVRISTPTSDWEIKGYRVNEGPAAIIHGGRVFLTFSASATDARYCMGLLTADANANLLTAASWAKTTQPVFTTNERTKRYGPGHNSFTVAEDGVTDVLVYHARDYRDITGDPLYDPNRHTRVQRLYWHQDGTPLFGVPVGTGGPIVRLTPSDAATSAFVRHYDFVVRVDSDVRELADTQFRFGSGLAGAGTESIQSVNYPDRYLRVLDGAVRIDQRESGTAFAGQASFKRVPSEAGVSLQLASDATRYLRHDRGKITVGQAAGASTTFRLS